MCRRIKHHMNTLSFFVPVKMHFRWGKIHKLLRVIAPLLQVKEVDIILESILHLHSLTLICYHQCIGNLQPVNIVQKK